MTDEELEKKDEKKEEMKNKISMALKDPILQQGFEIICKNLAELEKEKEQLKQKLDWFLTETVAGKEYRPKEELEDLQRENERLKAQIEKMKCCRNCKHWNVPADAFDTFCEECEKCKNCSLWELAE